jgi:hypothetical protein
MMISELFIDMANATLDEETRVYQTEVLRLLNENNVIKDLSENVKIKFNTE